MRTGVAGQSFLEKTDMNFALKDIARLREGAEGSLCGN